jgi:hypothetical protein
MSIPWSPSSPGARRCASGRGRSRIGKAHAQQVRGRNLRATRCSSLNCSTCLESWTKLLQGEWLPTNDISWRGHASPVRSVLSANDRERGFSERRATRVKETSRQPGHIGRRAVRRNLLRCSCPAPSPGHGKRRGHHQGGAQRSTPRWWRRAAKSFYRKP